MFNPVVEQLGTKSVAAALSRNGPRYFEIFHREVPITHLHYFVQVRARNWQHHIYAISHRVQIKPTGAGDGCGKTAEWQLKVLKGIVTFLQTNRRTIYKDTTTMLQVACQHAKTWGLQCSLCVPWACGECNFAVWLLVRQDLVWALQRAEKLH